LGLIAITYLYKLMKYRGFRGHCPLNPLYFTQVGTATARKQADYGGLFAGFKAESVHPSGAHSPL